MRPCRKSMPRIASLLLVAWACACTAASSHDNLQSIAQWAYPQAAPGKPTHHSQDEIIRVSDSRRTFRYKDLFGADSGAADWFPDSHPPLPPIVAHGTVPGAESCGGCHTVNGEGVPATAALAGLSRAYMLEQIEAFRRGLRGAHAPESATFMAREAKAVGNHDIAQAVDYFSRLTFKPHVRVVETASVPRTHWHDFALEAEPGGRREPIGQRIIEVPVHPGRLRALRHARRVHRLRATRQHPTRRQAGEPRQRIGACLHELPRRPPAGPGHRATTGRPLAYLHRPPTVAVRQWTARLAERSADAARSRAAYAAGNDFGGGLRRFARWQGPQGEMTP